MTARTHTARAVAPVASTALRRTAIDGLRSDHDVVRLLPGAQLQPDGGVLLHLAVPGGASRSWAGDVAIEHGSERTTLQFQPGPERPEEPTVTFSISRGGDDLHVEVEVEVAAGADGDLADDWRRSAGPLAGLLARNLAAPVIEVDGAPDGSAATPGAPAPQPSDVAASGDGPERRAWLVGVVGLGVVLAGAAVWWATTRKARS
jgi:hypothetical protein